MRKAPFRPLISLCLALAATLPALAQITPLPEIRGGIAVRDAFAGNSNLLDPARVRDVNVELLFGLPDLNAWTVLGELRPHLGATVNFDNKESLAYAGLSWTFRTPVLPLMAEVGGGAALHSGSFDAARSRFGCPVLAQAQASVGVDILPFTTVMATVQHATDFGLCHTPNDGMTTAGLRLGVRF